MASTMLRMGSPPYCCKMRTRWPAIELGPARDLARIQALEELMLSCGRTTRSCTRCCLGSTLLADGRTASTELVFGIFKEYAIFDSRLLTKIVDVSVRRFRLVRPGIHRTSLVGLGGVLVYNVVCSGTINGEGASPALLSLRSPSMTS